MDNALDKQLVSMGSPRDYPACNVEYNLQVHGKADGQMSSCRRCGADFTARGNQRYCGPGCSTQGATKRQQEEYYFRHTSRAIGARELEDKVNNVLRRGERDL